MATIYSLDFNRRCNYKVRIPCLSKREGKLISCINVAFGINWGRCNWGKCEFICTSDQLIKLIGVCKVNDVKEPAWLEYSDSTRMLDVRPIDD